MASPPANTPGPVGRHVPSVDADGAVVGLHTGGFIGDARKFRGLADSRHDEVDLQVNSVPSTGTGRRRPLLSKSPSEQRLQTSSSTLPLPAIACGAQRK